MIPVDQTRFGFEGVDEAPGNCWAACIASVLEVDLLSLPDEHNYWKPGMTASQSGRPYIKATHEWLKTKGLILVEAKIKDVFYTGPVDIWDATYMIFSGPSPRNPEFNHCVVGQGIKMVHDPHKSRAGLAGAPMEDWMYEFFVKMN